MAVVFFCFAAIVAVAFAFVSSFFSSACAIQLLGSRAIESLGREGPRNTMGAIVSPWIHGCHMDVHLFQTDMLQ